MTLAYDVKRLAIEMAKSGRHFDCIAIEAQLDEDGYPEAYVVLVDPVFRATLNALCRQSHYGRSNHDIVPSNSAAGIWTRPSAGLLHPIASSARCCC